MPNLTSVQLIMDFFFFSIDAYGIIELQTKRRGISFCNHSVAIITDKGLSAFPLKELNSAVKCPLA